MGAAQPDAHRIVQSLRQLHRRERGDARAGVGSPTSGLLLGQDDVDTRLTIPGADQRLWGSTADIRRSQSTLGGHPG
jgi:hypothetical protein